MNYIEEILNLVYPNVCGICGKINKISICNKCNIKIKQYINPKLEKLENNKIGYMYLFKYDNILREKMILYKFHENSYLFKMFSEIVIKNELANNFLKQYDIIIPVPIHKNRKKSRGYNQSELIAKELAKNLKIQITTNTLIKQKNNISQSTLNKIERIQNVKNVYALKNDRILKNKKVLIFDDIYTTGSTVSECIKTVKQAQPKQIGVLTLAKD
ncbi:MAG: ComF family protein [Oscillospiraceae bacterium]|nr:ComF family protein [Oscillospiraceae bacterium]